MAVVTDPQLIERLTAMWNGRSQYVLLGNVHYNVMTPNGKENPVFVPFSGGYDATSTGVVQAPEPKPLGGKTVNKAAPRRTAKKVVAPDVPDSEAGDGN